MKKISVIGLGYVGLPLALLADERGFDVVGIDSNKEVVNLLKSGRSHLEDEAMHKKISSSKIHFSNDFSEVKDVDIAIICVPTPVTKDKMPDLSIVTKASIDVASNLKPDSLLIIESTINPGVCNEIIIPAIQSNTNHVIDSTLYIAHCPERINPGDSKWNLDNINRVIGADSNISLDKAHKFYKTLIAAEVKKMNSLKEAEAVKIVENSFRDINIAFVNELAMSFHKLGINLENVIAGAATKPFAFMPHHPGCGVGGHCIPVDPYYLIEYAKGYGFDHEFLRIARRINDSMPNFTVDLLRDELSSIGKALNNSNVALLGISYKPNVSDARESPSYSILSILKDKGANVNVYDPFLKDESSCDDVEHAIKKSVAVIVATPHDYYDKYVVPSELSRFGVKVFIDGKNHYRHLSSEFIKYNIRYRGIGI